VLRRTFGPKREWKKLHTEELNDVYDPPNTVQKNEMGGACSAYGSRGVYRALVGGT
jgi:hypothetical protein